MIIDNTNQLQNIANQCLTTGSNTATTALAGTGCVQQNDALSTLIGSNQQYSSPMEQLTNCVTQLVNLVGSLVQSLMSVLQGKSGETTAVTDAGSSTANAADAASSANSASTDAASETGKSDILDKIKKGVDIATTILSFFGKGKIIKAGGKILKKGLKIGKKIINGVTNFAKNTWNKIKNIF